MKKSSLGRGCVVVALLGLVLVALVGGAWWFFMGQYTMSPGGPAPTSAVQVFLLSPSSGDDVAAGDFVRVDLKAVAPGALSWSELFVDGASLGAVAESPDSVSWTWQAWPAGVHVLAGRTQAEDGQIGESQTVIVNVVATGDVIQVGAGPSETLEQVGAKFGVPPDQMAAANPKLDPAKPLTDGQPVKVPTGGGGVGGQQSPGGGGNGPGGNQGPPFFIGWELKLTQPVDKSYCYLSDGSGNWEKMPKPPFDFFGGLDNLYSQVFDVTPPGDVTIQAQCWGWLGGVLKFLGQGETKSGLEGPVELSGDGFVLVGLPQWPQGKEEQFTKGGPKVPPPYALREAKDAADCTAHAIPFLGGFICNTLMNAPVKEFIILEWEWQPGLPTTGDWINDIDGYKLFQLIPDTDAPPKYMKTVTPYGAKAAAVPLPWGWYCYGVKAFVDDPKYGGTKASEMATYCPGQPPKTQQLVLSPMNWGTSGGTWMDVGDCDTYGGADAYALTNKDTGFGNQAGEVLVGTYIVDDDGEDCYREGNYVGGVKFPQPVLPPGGVVQKAVLKFSTVYLEYHATAVALGAKPANCVASIGRAKQDWSGLMGPTHFSSTSLSGFAYYTPGVSISNYMAPAVDVTSTTIGWIKNPASNQGFILVPVTAPNPSGDGTGECSSGLGNFMLEINYLAP